ncbi:FxsB family cyclophane-forming radical SAM/SPASM peptide maturase [Actinomadura opuntiae]|uniref:FxsB family cyclophane-forming radical SAM/SPASM peptide maturase n=1 Tax=Actinomadura sp. OS1-43 TaxID=604315 RepID=UPI00255B2A37|nr:FxsB family cyclophane-forming radical SAM/SPASM peptide maturase [Actinomadura sp. OS1-43]MDL4814578.1 FxsB family cyclophane-forming radical SAM/SPASM peptide maturase [Actinomadura sp. OS1-43]
MSPRTGVPEWPLAGLDVPGLAARGWRPVPFSEFVLKIHGRCNLACDYCYVYEGADQSWRTRPRAMPPDVVAATAARLGEHVREHALSEVTVVLHGGEPLLAGRAAIAAVIERLRAAVPSGCEVEVCTQTNGVLLTDATLAMLEDHDVGVSVSLDGDREGHDRHRLRADGRGSHAEVMRGLNRLAGAHRRLYRGLLCTIDLDNDPVRTYEALIETGPPRIDFLLPHGTWTAPPPRRPADGVGAPYAEWLIEVFDRWYHAPRKETGVRLFEEILNLLLGAQSRSENIGLSPVAMVVVDTDGTLQQVDTLKTSYAGAPETGLNVFDGGFDDALWHPGVVARQIGADALADTCRACTIRDVCGGGAYAHRYREGHGYRNPSVYCPDLMSLIGHIGRTVQHDLALATAAPSR